MDIPFSNQLGESYSAQSSKETLGNMFAEIDSGRAKIIRRQRPGLALVEAGAAGIRRGIQKLQGVYWLVVGTKFYEWDTITLIERGTLNTGTGPVTMATNNAEQIAVCDGLDLWVWDGSTFEQVVEDGFTPVQIASLGGYGIMNDGVEKGRFYTTALNDFKTIDALDFANAESNPDDIVRIFVDRGEAWMFGEETLSVYRLSGASFPLGRVTGSEIERGCIAPFSVASDDNTLFWLGDDLIAYRANGYSPERISTHAVERKIQGLAAPENGQAFTYTVGGNKFYLLNFPGELSLQFNIATGLWNECWTYLKPDWEIAGSAGRAIEYVLTESGICKLDIDVNKDIDAPLQRRAISPPLYNNGERFQAFSYFLDCEVGRIPSASGEPSVMMRVSRDGEGWGNIKTRSMAAMGEYKRRVTWRNLGVAREMQFELTMTDDAPFKVMGSGGIILPANETG